jgi:hypothetical protein
MVFEENIFFFRESGSIAVYSGFGYSGRGRCHPYASGIRHPPGSQVKILNLKG